MKEIGYLLTKIKYKIKKTIRKLFANILESQE